MKNRLLCLGLAAVCGVVSSDRIAFAQAPDPHAAHAVASGLKKELIEGLTAADFLRLSKKPKTVELVIVAAWTPDNYGMNFNGFSRGKAVYTVPQGWNVEVTFINPSPVPHSAVVVEREMTAKFQVGEPAFKGAAVPSALTGISSAKAAFAFTADEAGEYAIACGFPSHAVAGHWVALEVSASATAPSLKLGDAPATPASPAR